MYRITLQNILLSNKDKYSFLHLSSVPTSCVTSTLSLSLETLTLCSKDSCKKKTKLQSACARAVTYFPTKYKFANSA
jgi:hypothetical protein